MSTFASQALQQALIAASHDTGERARAIGALRGSEVLATTWPTDPSNLRTLLNSSGLRALALFTDKRHLDEAAVRYGWQGADGQVAATRLHISEAIRVARQQQVALVIVDIASDHALELDQGELELVAAPPSTRAPSYRGLSSVISTAPHADSASEVQRVSTHPPPPSEALDESAIRPSSSPLRPSSVNVDAAHHAVSATFGMATTATMARLPAAPAAELVDALAHVLRDYCEVEWACLVGELDGPSGAVSVALRIDTAFRKHLPEISLKLRKVSAEHGAKCDVLVLETVEQMKRARAIGLPFYPWRKR